MLIERWGSLSVWDHIDTTSLAANVLLYDRLVFPVMETAPDRDERAYWESHGRNPDLQRRRLEQLEELAIRRPWNASRREVFKTKLAELEAERFDAQNIDTPGMTRMILAEEQVVEKPPGVQHVEVIAAYNSGAAFAHDFVMIEGAENITTQAILLTRRLAIPDLGNPDETLQLALDLSREGAFREKRAALFDWQKLMALQGIPPDAAVERVVEMTDAYNAAVLSATKKVYWKLAFTVFGAGLGFAAGGPVAAAASAALSLVQFATLDRTPVIEPGRSAPAAMFHDIKSRVGFILEAG